MEQVTNPSQLDVTPFVRRWNGLVSTTNWEKGRIILEWRTSVAENTLLSPARSDEEWSRLVSGVTPQHVGRLRRVAERFGDVYPTYAGLYWSHFCAALDWDDAEMWLEGAAQNDWSIAQMREQRSAALGRLSGGDEPLLEVAEVTDLDEDFSAERISAEITPSMALVEGPAAPRREASPPRPRDGARGFDDPEGEDEHDKAAVRRDGAVNQGDHPSVTREEAAAVRPFAHLPPLPDDLTDALDAFKVAALRHKMSGWQQVSREDVLAHLQALQQMLSATDQDRRGSRGH